jgi:hypothetical protein
MTFVNVMVMTAILAAAMGASMLYYGGRGKKKMRQGMDKVAGAVGGTVTQPSRMHYPRLAGTVDGRPVEVFIHLSEGHRRTSDIIYLVLSTPVRLPSATLVVEAGYFAASPEREGFNDVAGDFLADVLPGHYVYGADEAATTALLKAPAVTEALAPLSRYPSIVLGPDAVTVGKPYGGAMDLLPERLVPELGHLVALAGAVEGSAGSVEGAGGPAPAAAEA